MPGIRKRAFVTGAALLALAPVVEMAVRGAGDGSSALAAVTETRNDRVNGKILAINLANHMLEWS